MPRHAHSRSEYRRIKAQGGTILPPTFGLPADLPADELIEMAKGWPLPATEAGDMFTGDLLIHQLGRALAAAEAEQQRLREVLDEAQTRISAFVDQFDAVVPHMAGMALMSQIHGVPYAGPQMDIEPLRELLKGDQ